MPSAANVVIHPSQFPEQVRRDLLNSLRTREVNHKFHYDSLRQTQKWLALHQNFSPSRNDADCAATYDRAFAAATQGTKAKRVHLVSLGCGGGQKDARLLWLLKERGKTLSYAPCDVSVAMVLVAREASLGVAPTEKCFPLVCDLATAEDLPEFLSIGEEPGSARLIAFFGMIPNFEPNTILPSLAGLVRPDDLLLFSANLAPGCDYALGVQKVLPQYDNALTRDWLMTFLLDLGVGRGDGELEFRIEEEPPDLGIKRIVAYFQFQQDRELHLDDEVFEFRVGEAIRLFFSYRYTPAIAQSLLAQHGLQVRDQWITKSEEEGVFLVERGG